MRAHKNKNRICATSSCSSTPRGPPFSPIPFTSNHTKPPTNCFLCQPAPPAHTTTLAFDNQNQNPEPLPAPAPAPAPAFAPPFWLEGAAPPAIDASASAPGMASGADGGGPAAPWCPPAVPTQRVANFLGTCLTRSVGVRGASALPAEADVAGVLAARRLPIRFSSDSLRAKQAGVTAAKGGKRRCRGGDEGGG